MEQQELEQRLQSLEQSMARRSKRKGILNKDGDDVMSAYMLYFDHGDVAKLEKKKIVNGTVSLNDKTWIVDTSKPILLKSKFGGFSPLFIIKHNNVFPDGKLNPILPEFKVTSMKKDGKKVEGVSPEVLRKTMSMKILGNMLKVKKDFSALSVAIISAAFGGFLIYYLIAMKVIKL